MVVFLSRRRPSSMSLDSFCCGDWEASKLHHVLPAQSTKAGVILCTACGKPAASTKKKHGCPMPQLEPGVCWRAPVIPVISRSPGRTRQQKARALRPGLYRGPVFLIPRWQGRCQYRGVCSIRQRRIARRRQRRIALRKGSCDRFERKPSAPVKLQ